jgi:hypothetical protein
MRHLTPSALKRHICFKKIVSQNRECNAQGYAFLPEEHKKTVALSSTAFFPHFCTKVERKHYTSHVAIAV